jgi:RNA polymerase sigma factor (sigma-70 family)
MGGSQLGVAESAPEGARSEGPSLVDGAWSDRASRLYEELRRPSLRMVRRAFGRAFADDDLEDLYASAWLGTLRALERRQSGLSDEEIRKYVLTAVAHHASKELRRRGRRPTAPLEAVGEVADVGPAPHERATSAEEQRLARDLLASLPPRRRAVMLLRYGCGLEPRQVCAMVDGLSARAYRKEITRGVDELTEKLRLVEQGEWCADREPLLKTYAAGLATEDERRQATHHLSRCRPCSELVGRLTGHLHDLGGALALPAALEGVGHGGSIHERFADVVDRVREAVQGPLSASNAEDVTAATASGGLRGGGAAGAGIAAKLAGFGAAGKVAIACLAGGAVATTCAATGLLPTLPAADLPATKQVAAAKPRATVSARVAASTQTAPRGAEALAATQADVAPDSTGSTSPPRNVATADQPASATVAPAATTTTPLAPRTPPVQQQFGVPSAAPSSPPSSGGSSGGSSTSGGTPAQQEFGP